MERGVYIWLRSLGFIRSPWGLGTCSVCSWMCWFFQRSLVRILGMGRLTGKWALQDEVLLKSKHGSCVESCIKPRDLYCSGSSTLTHEAVHVMKHLLWINLVSECVSMKQLPLLKHFFLSLVPLFKRYLFLLVIFFGKWHSCLQALKGVLSRDCQKH